MRHLKKINESNMTHDEILKSKNLTEEEYQSILDFISMNSGYSEVGVALPFLNSMFKNEDCTLSSKDQLDQIIKFYKNKKSNLSKLDELEDFLLKYKEDPPYYAKIKINKVSYTIEIEIDSKNIETLDKTCIFLNDINNRLKKAGYDNMNIHFYKKIDKATFTLITNIN